MSTGSVNTFAGKVLFQKPLLTVIVAFAKRITAAGKS